MRADHKDWSGQWLFGDPGPEEQAPPGVLAAIRSAKERAGALEPKPKLRPYYAAFVLDGDEMGKWLRGEKAPTLAETYHPAMLKYFESLRPALRDEAHALLAQKRPPSPAMHAALTAALGNYARDAVPPVLRTHHGELVYAGGDDVLGLLPVETALPCLRELRERYTGRGQPAGWEQHDGRDLTLMGDKATASAGVAIAHHKMDLREVLQAARAAEKAAKNAGRDALGLAILKRSGDHTTVVCPWDFVFRVELFAEAFSGDASDRWAYRLRSESEALLGLRDDLDALSSIIKQTVEHGSKDSKETIRKVLLVTGEELPAGQLVAREFRRFCETWKMRESRPKLANPLEAFIQLVQAASFLARGRDE
jgi:CRISPR-associated protein Cmr2